MVNKSLKEDKRKYDNTMKFLKNCKDKKDIK